jgi:predicted RecB family nuclease
MSENQLAALGLSDRVIESLEAAGVKTIRELARYRKQALIDLPGIGATSADRILSAVDSWFEEATAFRRIEPSTELDLQMLADEPVVVELLAACIWARDVLCNLGGQRGMFLGAKMRQRVESAEAKLTRDR